MSEFRKRCVDFIEAPLKWPLWPVLPMKRREDGYIMETGFVTADFPTIVLAERPTTGGIIAQLAMEDAARGDEAEDGGVPPSVRNHYQRIQVARFDDIGAMLDAGWEPD